MFADKINVSLGCVLGGRCPSSNEFPYGVVLDGAAREPRYIVSEEFKRGSNPELDRFKLLELAVNLGVSLALPSITLSDVQWVAVADTSRYGRRGLCTRWCTRLLSMRCHSLQ